MSFFSSGPTIQEVHDDLENLIKLQKSIVGSFSSQIGKMTSEQEASTQEVQQAVKVLVPTDDHERYAEITHASQQAGADFDCTALVNKWTQEDIANRSERAALEKKWGTRQQVDEKVAKDKETLEITTQALDETVTEITEFDKTTANIEKHNKKYPNNQITEASHDGYEHTSVLRWLGYWTVRPWWGGAHAAYLALGTYTQDNRDYYEYAGEVAKMRKTREGLQEQKEAQTKTYEEIAGVQSRMGHLDGSYKGPEGIAREIRSMVSKFLLKDDDFAAILNDHLKGKEAQGIAVAVAKIRVLGLMKEDLGRQQNRAEATLEDLKRPMDTLENALGRVGGQSIDYNMESIERRVGEAAAVSRASVKQAATVLQEVDAYEPNSGTLFSDMTRELRSIGTIEYPNNSLDLKFGNLEDLVSGEVREYEAEQERRRQAAAREAERQRKALEDAFKQASQTRNQRSNTGMSIDFGGASRGNRGIGSSPSPSISRQSTGIGSTPSAGISRGRRGIG